MISNPTCPCAAQKCAGNRKAGFKCVAKRANPCADVDCDTDVEHCQRRGKKCLRKPNKCAAAKCAANQVRKGERPTACACPCCVRPGSLVL